MGLPPATSWNALRPDEDVFIQKKGSPAGIASSHSCGMPYGLPSASIVIESGKITP
ncbi:MAG: hypothetical protein IPN29_15890 [Saprospiraceae bacterium]|nr:hypothetical protein [Saprospiraceae bacterium]